LVAAKGGAVDCGKYGEAGSAVRHREETTTVQGHHDMQMGHTSMQVTDLHIKGFG
jgi:hypothetical protein